MVDQKLKTVQELLNEYPGVYSDKDRKKLDHYYDKADNKQLFIHQLEVNLIRFNKLKKFKENLDRQKKEVQTARNFPGRIDDLESLSQQMIDMMGVEAVRRSQTYRWNTYKDGYGDEVGLNSFSASGGFSADLMNILAQDKPIIHTSLPDIAYQRNLVNAQNYLQDLQKKNQEDRQSLLDKGFYDGQPNIAASTFKERLKAAQNLSRAGFSEISRTMLEALESLGFLTTPSEKDKRYSNFINARNEALAAAVWDLNDKDNKSNIARLKECDNILDGCNGILDQASFEKMQRLIDDHLVKEDEEEKKKKLKALESRLNYLNDEMLGQMDQIKDDENAMWKFRALQLMLVLTPFGVFSFIGLDYMDFLGNILGPLFDSSMSIGEGVNYTINNELDFVGDAASFFGVDEMSQALFDEMPITSDIFSASNHLIDSELGQMGVTLVGNVMQTDAALFAIATGYSIYRLSQELDHREKTNKIIDRNHKELKEIFKDYNESSKNQKIDDFTAYAKKRLKVFQEMYKQTQFLNFLRSKDKNHLDIFDDINFEVNGQRKTLSQIKEDKLNFDLIFDDHNKTSLQNAVDRFLIIDYLLSSDDGVKLSDEYKAAKSLKLQYQDLKNKPQELRSVVESGKFKHDNQFLVEFFKKNIAAIGEDNKPLIERVDKINNLPQQTDQQKESIKADCRKLEDFFIGLDSRGIANLVNDRSYKYKSDDYFAPPGPSMSPYNPTAANGASKTNLRTSD